MDWGEEEIAIEIHCDAGQILTKAGNRAQIGLFGFMRKRKLNFSDENEFHQGVAISWDSSKSPMVTTSKESGVIKTVFYGFDMDRMLKGILEELLFGNIGVEISTYVRSDNFKILQQVESVKSVSKEKRLSGFFESNREELENNHWLNL